MKTMLNSGAHLTFILTGVLLWASCASQQAPVVKDPEWISAPARIVDNGYIVYTGTAEDMNTEKALFKAEGQALEDLANECSVIPKGTRIEDRYVKHPKYETFAYVKVGLDFPACEQAKKANDPEAIRQIANLSFMQQLKRYQDFAETGEMASNNSEVSIQPPEDWPEAPVVASGGGGGGDGQAQFFATRQYILYQKEVVVLSPPQYYPANSPESNRLNSSLIASAQQVSTYEAQNPGIVKSPQTWSHFPQKPIVQRPVTLRPGSQPRPQSNEIRPPLGWQQGRGGYRPAQNRPQQGNRPVPGRANQAGRPRKGQNYRRQPPTNVQQPPPAKTRRKRTDDKGY